VNDSSVEVTKDMKDLAFLKAVEDESGEKVSACYQCYKCTNSCPVLSEMDILPHRAIRYCMLGEKEKVLRSKTIWACLQCYTCSVRCPNDIHVGHVFDTLRKIAVREEKAEDDLWKFDEIFLDSIKRHGRIYEAELMLLYLLKTGQMFSYAEIMAWTKMGIPTMLKGRVGVTPHNIKDRKGFKDLFDRAQQRD
jgi:heterodisulfide reductase subunit C2